MRVCGACVLAAVLLSPQAFGPSGCSSTIEPQVGKVPSLTTLTESSRSGSDFRSHEVDLFENEPLIPAIRLGGETDPAHQQPPLSFGPLYDPAGPGGLEWNSSFLLVDFTSGARAHFHPHGKQWCASGCAASNHPTLALTPGRCRQLLAAYANGPMDETCSALESLLFYGRQTQSLLGDTRALILDPQRETFLRSQLSRTHTRVSFRIVDQRGVVRTELPPTRVPLDRRHVFEMKSQDLPPLVSSGTVKRVGLHHLWTRI